MHRFSGTGHELTRPQAECLMAASDNCPVYGERPSFAGAQTPTGGRVFDLRTVESLVRRGLLDSNGKGGFVPTPAGRELQGKAIW